MMKKKWLVPTVIATLLVAVVGGFFAYSSYTENKKQEAYDHLRNTWVEALSTQNFEELPSLVSKASLEEANYTAEDLIEKYTNLFGGIDVPNMNITVDDTDEPTLSYVASFDTAVGTVENLRYDTTIVEEDETYKLVWHASLIFPDMLATDKVRYTVETPTRGEIIDRNGVVLAQNGERPQAGVVRGALGEGEARTNAIARIAKALSITPEFVTKQLEQSWVTDDVFVPLKTMPTSETPVIDGVLYQTVQSRVYPLNEAAAHLIGYVGKVTAEDIEKNDTLRANDVIGRTGLEMTFDEQLRGKAGGEIYIETEAGEKRATIATVEAVHGETIQLTIDASTQQLAYNALGDGVGATAVMAPTTGDVLALVSKPSFNPNLFVTGISQTQYAAYNDNPNKPFIARYSARYAPGSTFKPITAAIGIEASTLNPSETIAIPDMKWQPNNSWGSYFVSRLNFAASVNLTTSLVRSDNIYYAQQALRMGGDVFREGLQKLVFDEELPVPLAMEPAQISNDETFTADTLVADTAYGQGQMLLSPLQMAATYSVLPNDGTIVYPKLMLNAEAQTKAVFKPETIAAIEPALIEVVTSPEGTGHVLNAVQNVAAKTGTAELKATQEGRGVENSLILAYDTSDQRYLAVSIIENYAGTASAAERIIPLLQSFK